MKGLVGGPLLVGGLGPGPPLKSGPGLDVVITSHLHWYSFIGYLFVTVLLSK